MRRYTLGNTVYINEGASKLINFYIFTPSGAAENLEGFTAKAYIEKIAGSKLNTVKECQIEENCISFKLTPKDTKGVKQARFEVRISDGEDVYPLIGMIVVKKSLIDFNQTSGNYYPDYTNPNIDAEVDGGVLTGSSIEEPDVPEEGGGLIPPQLDVDADGGELNKVEEIELEIDMDGGEL